MERDEESGLEYHHARYYLPWLGRWLSADPVGLKGGLNLYAYAHNNPLNATDTSGSSPINTIDVDLPAYKGPSLLVEVHEPDPSSLAGQAARGLSEVMTRAQFRNQEEREYNLKPGHWTRTQIEANYAEHPEDRAKDEIALEARYKKYYNAKQAELKKQQRRMDAAANVGTAIAHVTVTLITVPGGFAGTYIEIGALGTIKVAAKMAVGGIVAGSLTSSGGPDGGFGTVVTILGAMVSAGLLTWTSPKPTQRSVIVQLSDDKLTKQSAKALAKRTGLPIVKLKPGSLEGVENVIAIGHGHAPGNVGGASTVTIGGKNVLPEGYAQRFAEAGFKGGTVVMGSCRTGTCNIFGTTYAGDVANELGALSAPTKVIAPKNDVDFLYGSQKPTPTNGLPLVVNQNGPNGSINSYLPFGQGWETQVPTMVRQR